MKRFTGALMGALLTLTALVTFSSPSEAAWKWEYGANGGPKWHHTGRGDLGFSENGTTRSSDTLYVSAAPARADTTTEWTMLDVDAIGYIEQGSATADSVASAYFVIQSDSTTASTVNFKNTTVTLQVNYGQNIGGWSTVRSALSPLATDGAKILIVPIWDRLAAITTDLGIDLAHPFDSHAPRMRAIVTWGTSAAAPSSAIGIKKFQRDRD